MSDLGRAVGAQAGARAAVNPNGPPSIDSMTRLPLPSDLGIEHVAELQQQLAGHLDATALELDGEAVARVHTASLQLLHAFVRDRAGAGRSTTFTLASPTLAEAARTLALADSLGIGPEAAASPGEPA